MKAMVISKRFSRKHHSPSSCSHSDRRSESIEPRRGQVQESLSRRFSPTRLASGLALTATSLGHPMLARPAAARPGIVRPSANVSASKLSGPMTLRATLPGSSSAASGSTSRRLNGRSTSPTNTTRKDIFVGRCVGVLDGDTIYVEHDGQTDRVDLWGVDCPELGQPYGLQARQFTLGKVFGQTVRVRIKSHHKGRTLAFVDSGPGNTLNEELVGNGLAWYYPKEAEDTFLMPILQDTARQDKRGLWSDKEPTTPWQWRKQH